jgi:hypothetical protein
MTIRNFRHGWRACACLRRFLVLAFMVARAPVALTQDQTGTAPKLPPPTDPQSPSTVTAVPNRPTFSTTAESVQTGVFEIEYGIETADGHQNLNGLLKFGLFKNFELRFANIAFERNSSVAGRGDSGAGLKYRFIREKGVWPTISGLYTATIPTTTAELGAGALGHSLGILVSKDFGNNHLDFNESIQWLGRPSLEGFDRDYFTALAYAHPLTGKLGITAEVSGFSRPNKATPAIMTVLPALTYGISSRLVLDGGCYVALHGDLPRVTFFMGVTYSVIDLYHRRHGTRPRSK